MSGPYAHITLANRLAGERLDQVDGLSREHKLWLTRNLKFCELGAVSPDYPYMVPTASEAAWADRMHKERVPETIRNAAIRVKSLEGKALHRGFAWLLGYVAHVVQDMTIHPVVNLKVGPYEENKTEHRKCEMNQDAHIFSSLNLGEPGLSEHLDHSIRACSKEGGSLHLDEDIARTWEATLHDSFAAEFGENPPHFNLWHGAFSLIVDKIASEGNHLIPFGRHLLADMAVVYPDPGNLDSQYIENLKTPVGRMHYDDIFQLALDNVGKVWGSIGRFLTNGVDFLSDAQGWSLDSGKDENGRYCFWEMA